MLTKNKSTIAIAVLLLLHAVGLIGLLSDRQSWFLALTPINLLLSAALVWWNHNGWSGTKIAVLVLAFLVGMAVEIAGVATGVIFGEYSYGATLGPKLFAVPIVIGVNWAMLVYCSGVLVARLQLALWLKAAIAAALMVGLDVLLEPVAIKLDFWSWAEAAIPLQNYVAWFVVAFGLLLVFHRTFKATSNRVAVVLFLLQVAFFGALNLML